MLNFKEKKGWLIGAIFASAGLLAGELAAQPLDDVTLEFQDRGVVATIQLSGPVRYLSHFPQSHGKTLEIYYERVQGATGSEKWVDNEVRKSPPSGLIPSFTVTTRDQDTKPKLVVEFSREAEYSVVAGKDNRSLLITIHPEKRPVSTGALPFLPTIRPPLVTPASVATLTAEQAAAAEINQEAHSLMVQGREALAAKNNEAAVEAFNKLLMLPPNDYTQDGQEWVGVARERANQKERARVEYELYLRLYPEGESAAQVAQRLAGLSGAGVDQGIVETAEKKRQARWMTFGSVSSRYYFGQSTVESTQPFNNVPETLTTTFKDQSMLITSLDASERYVSDDYDGRLVFRDVNTQNFLANQSSQNRVYAVYGEIKNRKQDYMLRLGRQSSTGGGVMGRFDGLAATYGSDEGTKYNATAGTLVDYSDTSQPGFVGISVDLGSFSFYGINQTVGSVTDRRAVGAEYRYFEGDKTAFALVDYDAYFQALNAVQLMGTAAAFGGTMNFMADSRRAPSLSIRNALSGASTSSIDVLRQSMTESRLRELALARTATSNMGQVGLTVPYRTKWQVGGDLRLSNTTGLETSGTDPLIEGVLPATPGRGTETGVTMHLIGSGLYKDGDIWSGSVTFSSGNDVKGNAIYLYNHTLFASGWTMDTSLQLYNQTDQFGGVTDRISPVVRGAYRLMGQFYIDMDAGVELNDYSGAQQSTKTTRYFGSAGLRWDF